MAGAEAAPPPATAAVAGRLLAAGVLDVAAAGVGALLVEGLGVLAELALGLAAELAALDEDEDDVEVSVCGGMLWSTPMLNAYRLTANLDLSSLRKSQRTCALAHCVAVAMGRNINVGVPVYTFGVSELDAAACVGEDCAAGVLVAGVLAAGRAVVWEGCAAGLVVLLDDAGAGAGAGAPFCAIA